MESSNDNEPFPFATLSAATERVLEAANQKHEDRERDGRRGDAQKQDDDEQRRYVGERLKKRIR